MAFKRKTWLPKISSLFFLISIGVCWILFVYKVPINREMNIISNDMHIIKDRPVAEARKLIHNESITQITDEKSNFITYDCQSVNTPKNDHIFPNSSFFQAFSDLNSLLSQITDKNTGKPIEYSMSDGMLLHMYRDCGISMDEHDIDFLVPLEHIPKVKHTFEKSEHFGVWKQSKRLREDEIGYHFAGYHIETGVDIDIFSLNFVAGKKFSPMWIRGRLHSCWLPKNLEFGYKLKVNGFEFNVIGPIDEYLVSMYGEDWKIPIKTKDWNWKNPRCPKYKYSKRKRKKVTYTKK